MKQSSKTAITLPYTGKNNFIKFNKWILEHISNSIVIKVDLQKRKINIIVNNVEDAMDIFMHWV